MDRVYTAPGLNFMNNTPKEKEYMAKYKADTGSELVCVGDDRKSFEALKPQTSSYDLPNEVTAKFEG